MGTVENVHKTDLAQRIRLCVYTSVSVIGTTNEFIGTPPNEII